MRNKEGSITRNLIISSSLNIVRMTKSRKLRYARNLARMEEGRSAFKVLTDKHTGNRLFGKPRPKREDNITTDLK